MSKFMPIVPIEAFQYDGDLMNKDGNYYVPIWAEIAHKQGVLYYGSKANSEPCELFIATFEGVLNVNVGDYIIQEINYELSSLDKEFFEAAYELVED